jgi:hypothetical protein
MGTWAVPDTKAKKQKLIKLTKDFKRLRTKIGKIIGDDMIEDEFDLLEHLFNWALEAEWEEEPKFKLDKGRKPKKVRGLK